MLARRINPCRAAAAPIACLAVGLAVGGAFAAPYVDGISDQRLPVWAGAAGGPFGPLFRTSWAAAPFAQLTLARYVVQWNAMGDPSHGPNPAGDYRERLEAWLLDAQSMGLAPVLALTSYNGEYPLSGSAYRSGLSAMLALASADGERVGYVEAWNEPNGQGRESPRRAASIAGWAQRLCATHDACEVIAGDLLDDAAMADYERRYLAALPFAPRAWGVHPYLSVLAHSDARLLAFERALPGAGAGTQVWLTEVGTYYCLDGHLRGQLLQAQDARYLLDGLALDARPQPAHIFYYGFSYGAREPAPCGPGAGADTELYEPDGEPRLAAAVVAGTPTLGGSLSLGASAVAP